MTIFQRLGAPALMLAVMLGGCSGPSSTGSKDPSGPATGAPGGQGPDGRRVGEWEILRSVLRRHIDRGAGEFNSKLRVRAAFMRNRFYGWKVLSYRGPGKKIRSGDIITSINDKSIERPNQCMAIWNSLARSNHLVVKLVRQGKPMVLRYTIVD